MQRVLTRLSAVLLILAAAGMILSMFCCVEVGRVTDVRDGTGALLSEDFRGVAVGNAAISFGQWARPVPRGLRWTSMPPRWSAAINDSADRRDGDPTKFVIDNSAFGGAFGMRDYSSLPLWPVVLALGVLSPWFILRERRRETRRVQAGQCPKCGYDLRATPSRCPECGRSTQAIVIGAELSTQRN
jgi:hypothetical protein